jgi:hypothetical protein
MSLAARPGTAVEPLCSIASTASPSCRANAAASCSNWPGQGRVVVHDGDGGHARSVGTRGWLLSQTAVEAEISAFPVGESPMAVRHPASNPSRTNQAGLSMTPQEVMPVMRCHAVHGRRVRSERNYEWRSRWLSLVVGLGGLEPPASSLSEIDGRPLCYPAFPLVVRFRKSYRDGVNCTLILGWRRIDEIVRCRFHGLRAAALGVPHPEPDVSPAEWSSGCESPTVQNAGRGGLDHDEATPAHPGADRPQAP